MVVDIRGVNTHNKGAQLMMIALAENLRPVVVSTSPNGSRYSVRSSLGYQQTLIANQPPMLSAALGSLAPRRIREHLGLSSVSDITAVVDAAGYAYGDSFSSERAKREGRLSVVWRRRGIPRVFMPQAFGPFTNMDVAASSKRLLDDATVIYARDSVSASYLADLCPKANVQQCVDFTLSLPGVDVDLGSDEYGVVVPNSKMYTHSSLSRDDYISMNMDCVSSISSAGLRPVVMAHESTDRELAAEIASKSGAQLFWDPSPLVLKGLVKGAAVTVGSRYHALVGSLSSGRPTVALGWSHKYDELFEDFGVATWLAPAPRDVPALIREVVTDSDGLSSLCSTVDTRKLEVKKMWSDVVAIVNSGCREG